MADSTKTFLTPKSTSVIYAVFKYFYIISAGFLVLAAISYAVVDEIRTAVGILPSIIVSGVIAYGLFKKRAWTAIVITILAAFGIITNFLRISTEPVSAVIIIAILVFEIYFFNNKTVKAKMGTKGNALF